MIRRLIWTLTIISMFTTCSTKSAADQVQKEISKPEDFKSIYDTLDQLNIPIKLTPDNWSDLYNKHVEKYGIRFGERTLDHPFAKLTENENYKAFIFVSTDETGSPVIITFDRKGNKIDGLGLLGDWGGNDPSIGTTEIAIINKDLTIHLIDSTWTYDLTPDGDRIESSEKLTTKNELYRILNSGKIERVD